MLPSVTPVQERSVLSVSIVGTGRVGTHLARRLHKCGVHIKQIYNRDLSKAYALATEVQAQVVTNLEQFGKETTDVVILAVKDSAISDVAQTLKLQKIQSVLVHTSGTVPIAVLQPFTERFGGFYPLMTFAEGADVPWEQVPVGVNASNADDLLLLQTLAQSIGAQSFTLLDEQRVGLHVAAVFANNFTNHIIGMSYELLQMHGLDKALLQPLIEQTVQLALAHDPYAIQTGPARRRDAQTIATHLELLRKHRDFSRVYQLISGLIQKA